MVRLVAVRFMKLLPYLFTTVACAVIAFGCAPKKEPKPNVTAATNAAVAAANEGTVAATPVDAAEAPKDTAAVTPLPVIGPAPAWKMKDLEGKTVSSDDFKGKVVVLDFWATWCPPCRAEIPGYVDLYRKYGKDKLVIIGASVDEGGPAVVKDFVTKFGVAYPVVMADDATQAAFGGLEGVPTTFLIDQNGQLRDKKIGAEPTEEYEKKILALLK